jgi:hypothetical protein
MLFPNLSNFAPGIEKMMLNRRNNVYASGMSAWVRLTASGGLVIETNPQTTQVTKDGKRVADTDNFNRRYGNGTKSGAIGSSLWGDSVFADGNDRGFRPSPTVESLSISFGTGGLSRKCTFDITAYTLKQAEKICEYFLEPGYTVLVEFGWNNPASVHQKIKLDNYCEYTRFLQYNWLKNKQEAANYMYDGFLGYITGGGMKSAEGEKYIISVELTTIGEIPMYLQQHRGGNTVDASKNKGGEKFNQATIDKYIDDGAVGVGLFMQMYNRLPEAKQTASVKKLLEDGLIIPHANHEGNYINMDDDIKKEMLESLTNTNIESETDDASAKIPEGAPLISDSSYIKLGLAFDILNAYSIKLKAKTNPCGESSFSYVIDYKNTICRAHKHIFSIDGSKMMIPNPVAPDFGLLDVLKSSTELSGSLLKKEGDSVVPNQTQNLYQFEGTDTTHTFPQQVPLSESRYKWVPDAEPFDLPAGTYGFLEDLYVNFEFFCEVLGRANYVTKDIYLELLNGISTAANSIWHFEIEQIPGINNKGMYQLTVVDLNLCGITPSIYEKATKFQSSGINTPFLSSELSLDIPGAMKSMIVGKRSDSKPDAISEGNLPFQSIFATKQDPVLKLLESFQIDNSTTPPSITEEPDEDAEDQARKKNYEVFMSKATVVPKVKDRTASKDAAEGGWYNPFSNADVNIEEIVNVVAWSDPDVFRALDKGDPNSKKANNVLVPITFTFTILGLSGIKTGDMFRIEDLPAKFKDSVFQVVEVSHELSENLWKTTVVGKMRNIS